MHVKPKKKARTRRLSHDPEKLKAFLASPEGRTELERRLRAADEFCRKLDEARRVTPEMMRTQVTI